LESDFDVVIVGAGVVGLAIAASISHNQRTLIIEKNSNFGLESSSHNSEVIHAGIYYPIGSNKHLLCIEGNKLLYEWCNRYQVRHKRVGKVVNAINQGDLQNLEDAWHLASESGARVRRLTLNELKEYRKNIAIEDGFFSIDTGILDSVNFLKSLEYFAKQNETFFAYNTFPINIQKNNGNFNIQIKNHDDSEDQITANLIINAAGHGAPQIAAMTGYKINGEDANVPIFKQHVNRGIYYDIVNNKINHSINNLIYPVPINQEPMQGYINSSGGLGIHLTKTLDGNLKLGPDAEWLNSDDEMDYINDGKKAEEFYFAGKSILPKLNFEDIAPAHIGYRSRLHTKENQYADFLIWKDKQYIHLGGIESPGLTSSLAIAKKIKNLL
tara:strand:+ start:15442 stop:16593 length:1152 start_codon:yes stop_codon:yes gene_type:complete